MIQFFHGQEKGSKRRKGKISSEFPGATVEGGPGRQSTESYSLRTDPSLVLKSLLLSNKKAIQKTFRERFRQTIHETIFRGIPEHYPLRKKIQLVKAGSTAGTIWEMVQLFITFFVCSTYIASTYNLNLRSVQTLRTVDVVVTMLFLADYLLNFFLRPSWAFVKEFQSLIDILAMLPAFLSFGLGSNFVLLNFLRCLRILRIMRMFNSLTFLRTMNSVSRQVLILISSIVCILFLAAGIVQLLENDTRTYDSSHNCRFVNALTDWMPSCDPKSVATKDCDCADKNCAAIYLPNDLDGQPTGISCQSLTFFDAFYFAVVTVATVGYGDIWPHAEYSKAFIIILLIGTIITIPIIVSDLQHKLSLRSPYRVTVIPAHNENHVILCGHVSNISKLKGFVEEFFHPDRQAKVLTEYRLVILSSHEPNDELKYLLQHYDRKLFFMIGSALNVDDLKRARADSAKCIFLLGNTDASTQLSNKEDAGTVLRALSVSNFNPKVDIFVQVLRPEERRVLHDSDIECILCMNEYRISVLAKNTYCRGFSTFVENLFHSTEAQSSEILNLMAPWYNEYLHGASMELYFVVLDELFLRTMLYNFRTIAEAIMLEYECIVLGYCNEEKTECLFNPQVREVKSLHRDNRVFFKAFNLAIIMADDQQRADEITKGLANEENVRSIIIKMELEEEGFSCREKTGSFESSRDPSNRTKPSSVLSRSPMKPFKQTSAKSLQQSSSLYFETDPDDHETANCIDNEVQTPYNPQNYIGYTSFRNESTVSSLGKVSENEISGPPVQSFSPVSGGSQKAKLVKSSKTEGTRLTVKATATDTSFLPHGSSSRKLQTAFNLANHIIICAGNENAYSLVSELRLPSVCGEDYHSILIIGESLPLKWDEIVSEYSDVFFLEGDLNLGSSFKKANINSAFAVVFLVAADTLSATTLDANADSSALIMFLKLQQNIPQHIAFSVGLTNATSIAVLNATIVRRLRREELEEALNLFSEQSAPNQLSNAPSQSITKDGSKERRGSVMAGEGRFYQSKLATNVVSATDTTNNEGPARKGRRGSALVGAGTKLANFVAVNEEPLNSMLPSAGQVSQEHGDTLSLLQQEETRYLTEKKIWETVDNHYIFPVFASAMAFVPSSFESLLVQSFFVKLAPTICEKLIGGQGDQHVLQRNVPHHLVGKRFIDIFRLYNVHNALVFGIYRAPEKKRGASLPYVYTSPPSQALIESGDKLFVFGSHLAIMNAENRSKITASASLSTASGIP